MSDPEDYPGDLFADPYVLAGMWANWTLVHRGRNEFTIDFIRNVPEPPRRSLVARAIIAPVVALELREQLDETWREYTQWSMPGVGQ